METTTTTSTYIFCWHVDFVATHNLWAAYRYFTPIVSHSIRICFPTFVFSRERFAFAFIKLKLNIQSWKSEVGIYQVIELRKTNIFFFFASIQFPCEMWIVWFENKWETNDFFAAANRSLWIARPWLPGFF